MPTTSLQTATAFSFSAGQQQQLYLTIKRHAGILPSTDVAALCQQYNQPVDVILRACLPIAAQFAVAPISQFFVGAIVCGLDAQGEQHFYFGANVEFTQQALSLVVHAEQSAINNAWLNGAKKIVKIAISDAPCGYCRQFMNELADAQSFDILLPKQQFKLAELLPYAFGPQDLGNAYSLFNPAPQLHGFAVTTEFDEQLLSCALAAYVPYSGNYSAVKISTFENGDFYGCYAENAAYSPSLSPLQSAVSQLHLAGLTMSKEVVKGIELLQTQGKENQLTASQAVLASYNDLPALQSISLPLKIKPTVI
ncbi:cytidine deaminase [Pseudoalteromonas haloplanktis]|uniref:Cytidine deaminase n=1 Tax=Pseudoalteromonas haloplanktis TaxID=228 RepID=A0ABU1BFH4_PSEHA|nr:MULTISPECIES: cytidine deaminase [Pseudoalteromonas]MDQ9093248.1 cytidine deaminase [Pseudoalteromonas haloplanktis]TMN72611.1 cytidine deaminase [Pseudoalteromonas sp. S1727]